MQRREYLLTDVFMEYPDDAIVTPQSEIKQSDIYRALNAVCGIVVCLNIGIDPPDIHRHNSSARKYCWFDPNPIPKEKALELIGNLVEGQYRKILPKAKYKILLDPTPEDFMKACLGLRRLADMERVLFYYNGHGAPRSTRNGDIWAFGSNYSHYMPIAVSALRQWVGTPAMFIFDCHGAGALIPQFLVEIEEASEHKYQMPTQTSFNTSFSNSNISRSGSGIDLKGSRTDLKKATLVRSKEVIVFCACKENEMLTLDQNYSADIFTCCLINPIPTAVRCFILQNPFSMSGIDPNIADLIPGNEATRNTLFGQIFWVYLAVMEAIAWSSFSLEYFQKYIRQEQSISILFRNFIFAKKIMSLFNCHATSLPVLPDTNAHPLWAVWDMVLEEFVLYLVKFVKDQESKSPPPAPAPEDPPPADDSPEDSPDNPYLVVKLRKDSPPLPDLFSIGRRFFIQHLHAFEVWIDFYQEGNKHDRPLHLPILLHALLVKEGRIRPLGILRKYVSIGPDAVSKIMDLGLSMYLMRLTQSDQKDRSCQLMLVHIWAHVLGSHVVIRNQLLDNIGFFLMLLHSPEGQVAERCMAACALAQICNGFPRGQETCQMRGLMNLCCDLLTLISSQSIYNPILAKWVILCLDKLLENYGWAKYCFLLNNQYKVLLPFLVNPDPEVRAVVMLALGETFGASSVDRKDITATPFDVKDRKQSVKKDRRQSTGKDRKEQDKPPDYFLDLQSCELKICVQLIESYGDGNAVVRREILIAVSRFFAHGIHFRRLLAAVKTYIKAIDPFGASIIVDMDEEENDQELYKNRRSDRFSELETTSELFNTNNYIRERRRSSSTINVNSKHDPPTPMFQELISLLSVDVAEFIQDEIQYAEKIGQLISIADCPDVGSENVEKRQHIIKLRAEEMAYDYAMLWMTLKEIMLKESHPLNIAAALTIISTVQSNTMDLMKEEADERERERASQPFGGFRQASLDEGDVGLDVAGSSQHDFPDILQNGSIKYSAESPSPRARRLPSRLSINSSGSRDLQSPTGAVATVAAGSPTPASTGIEESTLINENDPSYYTISRIPPLPLPMTNNIPGSNNNGNNSPLMTSSSSNSLIRPQFVRAATIGSIPPIDTKVSWISEVDKHLTPINYKRDRPPTISTRPSFSQLSMIKTLFSPIKDWPPPSPCSNTLKRRGSATGRRPSDNHQEIAQLKKWRDRLTAGNEYSKDLLTSTLYEHHMKILLKRPTKNNEGTEYVEVIDELSKEAKEEYYSKRIAMIKNAAVEELNDIFDEVELYYHEHAKYNARISKQSTKFGKPEEALASVPDSLKAYEVKFRCKSDDCAKISTVLFHSHQNVIAFSYKDTTDLWCLNSRTRLLQLGKDFSGRVVREVSSLQWINEDNSNSKLLVCTDDGAVRVWKNTLLPAPATEFLGSEREQRHPATPRTTAQTDGDEEDSRPGICAAFAGLTELDRSIAGFGVVTDFHQESGALVVAGNSQTIRLWNLQREQCTRTFVTENDTCVTSIALHPVSMDFTPMVDFGMDHETFWSITESYEQQQRPIVQPLVTEERQPYSTLFFAGFADGSFQIYDDRVAENGGIVAKALRYHNHSVILDIHPRLRSHSAEIITIADDGSMKCWDIRRMHMCKSLTLMTDSSQLTAVTVHKGMPLVATATNNQVLRIQSLGCDSIWSKREGFLFPGYSKISKLAFHSYLPLLAAGSADGVLTVYRPPWRMEARLSYDDYAYYN